MAQITEHTSRSGADTIDFGRPTRVLIIEDDENVRVPLVELLNRDKFHAFGEAAAEDIVSLINYYQPDVVMLDVILPGVDGLSVLQTIREYWSNLKLPVLMLTSERKPATVVEAFAAGADDFISKPVEYPIVAARIRSQAARKFADEARQNVVESMELQVQIRTTELELRNIELESEVQRRREMEFALNAARAEAEESNEAKNRFLQGISHELGTPLNAIIGFAELALKGIHGEISPPEYKDYVKDILAGGKHLKAVLENILHFAQSDSGKIPTYPIQEQVKDVVHRSLKLVDHVREKNNVKVVVDESTETSVYADTAMVGRALTNVLSNALRHSPPGGTVTVSAELDELSVTILVKDEGNGISAETMEHIMEPFSRPEEHFVRIREGTGLGLAVSRYLIELNEGVIWIDSEEGMGTTVHISLPNGPDHVDAD